jgi:hypothetical protein
VPSRSQLDVMAAHVGRCIRDTLDEERTAAQQPAAEEPAAV